MFQKVKVLPFQQGTAEFDYTKHLTSYAAGFVLKQLELVSKVKDIKDDGSGQYYKVQTSAGKVQVSEFDCGCIFHQSMLLPCRHMFALRKCLASLCMIQKSVTIDGHLHITNQHKEFLLVLHHLHH